MNSSARSLILQAAVWLGVACWPLLSHAQVPPTAEDKARYTGLLAAAARGDAAGIRTLIEAGAPLDHVNNLGWTALIESIVLGDGGPRHVATLEALVEAGANLNLPDRHGQTPLTLARRRGYGEMQRILERAGAKERNG
jgi:hypothetical protein